MKNNAELWGAIYRKLQEIDEYKKQRKMTDRRQILLDESIKRAEKELRCKKNQ